MDPVKYAVRNRGEHAIWRMICENQVVRTTYRKFRIELDHIDEVYDTSNIELEELYNVR